MSEPATRCCDVLDVRSNDRHEAQRIGEDVYHPHELKAAPTRTPFEMRLRAASLGAVTVGVLAYSDEVRIATGPFGTSYQINVPLDGVVDCRDGDRMISSAPGTGAVFGPSHETAFTGFAGGGRLVGIKIEADAIAAGIAELTGSAEPLPELPPTLDVGSGLGAQWWSIARALVGLLDTPGGLIAQPAVTRPLVRALVTGLLSALGVPGRGSVGDGQVASTPTVRRAVDYLEARAADPITITELGDALGVSPRTLQAGFRRDLDTTPMGYLRDVRLGRAHAELLDADPARVTVGDIARRWGFDNLGRFAAAHHARFGTTPGTALRRGG